jgi:hypothetical protein
MYYLAGKVSDVGVNFEMNVIRGDLIECLSTLLTAPKICKIETKNSKYIYVVALVTVKHYCTFFLLKKRKLRTF